MAWTEQCKVAFEFGLRAKLKKGLNKTEGIRELSSESGMPYHTLRDWHYSKETPTAPVSRETPTTPISSANTSQNNTQAEEPLCTECHKNPPRPKTKLCHSCSNKRTRANKLKQFRSLMTQIKSIREAIFKEGTGELKWKGTLRKQEYEEFIDVLIETIKVWEDLSNAPKIES